MALGTKTGAAASNEGIAENDDEAEAEGLSLKLNFPMSRPLTLPTGNVGCSAKSMDLFVMGRGGEGATAAIGGATEASEARGDMEGGG